jgi:hypothetical protein
MLPYLVKTIGGWLGVFAPVSLQIAEGVLLAGIILSAVWFVIVLIAAAVLRKAEFPDTIKKGRSRRLE